PSPAPVPETPAAAPGAADATQVLPGRAAGQEGAYDPNAMTSVLPPVGAADATTVLPATGGPGDGVPEAAATSVMPPVERPDTPHPWQTQMRAARDRNEQTQVHYLDPSEDPLRRRPQRQAPPPPPPQQRPQRPQQPPQYRQAPPPQYPPQPQHPQAPQYQQPPQQAYYPQPQQAPPPPQPYRQQQPAPQAQPYRQPQAPQQPQQAPPPQRPAREPREPRERRRSANPIRIPGLGCLKGCLVMILVFFVAGWLVWELTPLQSWIGTGKGWFDQLWSWGTGIVDWVTSLGDTAGTGSGTGAGTP
ncbi:serine/threonine protein kinase, partial [Streptomyces toxytricini]